MTTTTANVQQKYSNLRRRLDKLGYTQTLAIESLPLADRLLADLIHTTESLKNSKLVGSKKPRDTVQNISEGDPYKSDNAKLVKENNSLNQEIIKLREGTQSNRQESKATVRKLENENADLKFLNTQYVYKVRQLEKESKEKSDRILQLQEKNFHAVVHTPGGKKKSIPFRRQRMELDSTVPAGNDSTNAKQHGTDPYIADLLHVADKRVSDLESQLVSIVDQLDSATIQLKQLQKQVQSRDTEIERLNRMLDGGRPSDVVALESRNCSNERMISHLNIQVDFLQQKNSELERKYKHMSDDRVDAMNRAESQNLSLKDKLKNAAQLANTLEADKEYIVEKADGELNEAKDELEKSRSELCDLDQKVAVLTAENKSLIVELTEIKRHKSDKDSDRYRLEQLLDKVQEDKRRLTQKVNKLTANERELVLEIERLKSTRGVVTKKKGRAANKLDVFIRGLEEERDYYRDQADAFEKLIRYGNLPPPRSRSTSPARGRSVQRSGSPKRSCSPKRSLSPTKSPSPTRPKAKNWKKAPANEGLIRILQDELEHYKDEVALLKSQQPHPTSAMYEGELGRVLKERDELQMLLDKFERHMEEIQNNVKILAKERDQISLHYEQCKAELQQARRQIVKSPKSAKSSLAAQAVLRRVENERDDSIADLSRMMTERDSLRERLKMATETSLAERARIEDKLAAVEKMYHNVKAERDELAAHFKILKKELAGADHELVHQTSENAAARDEAAQHQTAAMHMRLLASEAELSLGEVQKRLTYSEDELRNQEAKRSQLEERIADLLHHGETAAGEIKQLRATIASVDRDKDTLQVDVDEKTEQIAALKDAALTKDRDMADLSVRVTELENSLEHANDSITLKDRELKSLRRQLDSTATDLSEMARTKDNLYRENKRLQDDLSVMTRENQSLHNELQDAVEEKEKLRNQTHQYITDIKRIEDLLAAKENERSDLLEQYRQLSAEAEEYQTNYHLLENEGSNLRMELMAKDSEIRRYRERMEQQNRDVEQHKAAHQKYDLQITQMTRTVSALEDASRQTEDDRQSMLHDLAAMRDLCSQLEGVKDSLQRKLTTNELDKEQLEQVIDEQKTEISVLQSQVSAERKTTENLETLLSSNRERDFQATLTTQEKDNEIHLFKDRLSLNESKLQSQNREIATLRTRNMEMEQELERSRRNITNERFERERAVQELRRHCLTPPITDASRSPRTLDASYNSRLRSPERSAFSSF